MLTIFWCRFFGLALLLAPVFAIANIYSKQLDFRLGANVRATGVYMLVNEDCERVCNNAENSSAKSIKISDDAGKSITLTKPAQRIISLAPNITEILFAIGAGKNIVGVSDASDYPAAAKKIPIVANAVDLNLEAIIALHPDLIVAWQGGNPTAQLLELKKFGIPVYCARFENSSDITRTMTNLATLTGNEAYAGPIIKKIQNQFRQLRAQYGRKPKLTVFYQLWQTPLLTINQHSIINKIITMCAGINIFANTRGAAPEVGVESVLEKNPQIIITSENKSNWQAYWRAWPQILAVKNHNLFSIPADLIERPGPRLVTGAQMLCMDLELARKKSEMIKREHQIH